MRPLLVRGGRVIDPSQALDAPAQVLLVNGRVEALGPDLAPPDGAQVLDATGLVVCPGFVDLHTHLREPGEEEKETIATGALAGVRGGFTTLCAMPNTLPPIDTPALVEAVRRRAEEAGLARVLPIACVSKGRQGKELAELADLARAGAVAFSDDGSPVANAFLMRTALHYSTLTGLPIINHLEEPALARGVAHEGWVASRLGLPGIPPQAEESMAGRDIALCALTGGRLHLAHISTAGTAQMVRWAKERGLPVTAEATPHHLCLTDEWLLGTRGEGSPFAPLSPSAYDTHCKVNPPLRTRFHRDALQRALREGVIDAIATDHAPHTPVDKACTFQEASFGISGLETAFALCYTILVAQEGIPLLRLLEALTVGPARVLGEKGKGLGSLRPGSAGDLVVLDLRKRWTVDPSRFASKGKNTPLAGVTLQGMVVATVVGGRVVYDARSSPTGGRG
ncbi:Dihydroorotase [bacterium HR23]|nr:Dihydroorotase [bacterium HR23]